jgi:glycosyltransferase AglE
MSDESHTNLPAVSIIVPVYNCSESITALIESLLDQEYPKNLYEVILVDNNSSDNTPRTIEQYPVKLLHENNIQSSYAARNKGIKAAKYDYLAFTDADCIPNRKWLSSGISTLIRESADLAGGNIEFIFPEKPTNAQLYDSITHLNTKAYVNKNSSAPTANLFTRSDVFEKTSLFPEVKSGGDYSWTNNAVKKGFKIVYAPDATVKHPARKLGQLLKKRHRIGAGDTHIRLKKETLLHEIFYTLYNLVFTGIPISFIDDNIKQNGSDLVKQKRTNMLLIAYLCRLSSRFGAFLETIKILFGIVKPK